MDEAQHLADRIVVLGSGRVIAEGTPDTLGRDQADRAVVAFVVPAGVAVEQLPLPAGAVRERDGERVSFTTERPTRDLAPLIAWADSWGVELERLTVTRPSLEDVYLQLTEEAPR